MKPRVYKKLQTIIVLLIFSLSMIATPSKGHAQGLNTSLSTLPAPGTMVFTSVVFTPPMLRGLIVNSENPFQFEFVLDDGDADLTNQQIKDESMRLIKYFLASLTMPEEDLWVNLSPYEKNRIIPDEFGKTEMGQALLEQDYLLKQFTASLLYPENDLGKAFWDKVYKKAYEQFGTTEIPVNTFNKVWIVPDKALIQENTDRFFVVESHLKVMLEEDYAAMQKNSIEGMRQYAQPNHKSKYKLINGITHLSYNNTNSDSELSTNIIREIIIPEIEREVNEGKNFAQLRQVYNSFILASWYKKNLKVSLINQKYSDQRKVPGLEIEDIDATERIYQQYLEAFKIGVYDLIKEDYDATTKETIPRRYFSGGVVLKNNSAPTTREFVANGNIYRVSSIMNSNNPIELATSAYENSEQIKTSIKTIEHFLIKTRTSKPFDAEDDPAFRELLKLYGFSHIDLDKVYLRDSATLLEGLLFILGNFDIKKYKKFREIENNTVSTNNKVIVEQLSNKMTAHELSHFLFEYALIRYYLSKKLEELGEAAPKIAFLFEKHPNIETKTNALRAMLEKFQIFQDGAMASFLLDELNTHLDNTKSWLEEMLKIKKEYPNLDTVSEKKYTKTIEEILYLQKIIGDLKSFNNTKISPADIKELINWLQHINTIDRKEINIKLEMNNFNKIDFYFSKTKLYHIIKILIDNAIQAHNPDKLFELSLEISLREEENKSFVNFVIIDNAKGMTEEQINHIHDGKGLESTKGQFGKGEGIAVIQEIVREYSGMIYVESTPGEGTTFVLSFPANANKPTVEQKIQNTDKKGGIDLNPDYLDVETQGNKFNLPTSSSPIELQNMHIEGLIPTIIQITPVINLPYLLGKSGDHHEELLTSNNLSSF